jgi:hypothetical protein
MVLWGLEFLVKIILVEETFSGKIFLCILNSTGKYYSLGACSAKNRPEK